MNPWGALSGGPQLNEDIFSAVKMYAEFSCVVVVCMSGCSRLDFGQGEVVLEFNVT